MGKTKPSPALPAGAARKRKIQFPPTRVEQKRKGISYLEKTAIKYCAHAQNDRAEPSTGISCKEKALNLCRMRGSALRRLVVLLVQVLLHLSQRETITVRTRAEMVRAYSCYGSADDRCRNPHGVCRVFGTFPF